MLGAAVVSLFICCRLISSIAGSVVLLNEAPKSPMTFAGFALVALALTSFMALKFFDKPEADGTEGGGKDASVVGGKGAAGGGAADVELGHGRGAAEEATPKDDAPPAAGGGNAADAGERVVSAGVKAA